MATLSVRSGSEGPSHDPYAYEEFTLKLTNGSKVIVHAGLDEWVSKDGRKERGLDKVEELTGLSLPALARLARKVEERPYRLHRKHGGYKEVAGFPGESLCICKCGEVIDVDFDESAII